MGHGPIAGSCELDCVGGCSCSSDVIPNRAEGAVRDLTSDGSATAANGNAPAISTLEPSPASMPLRGHRKVPHRAFGPVRDDIWRARDAIPLYAFNLPSQRTISPIRCIQPTVSSIQVPVSPALSV